MYGGGLISFLGDNLVIFQMIVWESIFRAANWSEKSSQYPNLDNLANIARISSFAEKVYISSKFYSKYEYRTEKCIGPEFSPIYVLLAQNVKPKFWF